MFGPVARSVAVRAAGTRGLRRFSANGMAFWLQTPGRPCRAAEAGVAGIAVSVATARVRNFAVVALPRRRTRQGFRGAPGRPADEGPAEWAADRRARPRAAPTFRPAGTGLSALPGRSFAAPAGADDPSSPPSRPRPGPCGQNGKARRRRAFPVPSGKAHFFSASRICISTSSSVGPAGAGAASSFRTAASFTRFTILTSRKTTNAMIRKLITAVMKEP